MTSPDAVGQLGNILGVWAHPDDEVYLSGGLMALAADAGARVACVTATRGERGSVDPARWPLAELVEIRSAELASCLITLGVSEHYWLECRDGECARVPEGEVIGKLRALIAEVQPDTVLTFGPDGLTGHPDHRAVARWAVRAFRAVARPRARLLCAAKTPEWVTRFGPLLEPLGAFVGGLPPQTPKDDLIVDLQLPPPVLDRKIAALGAHASQIGPLVSALGEDLYRDSVAEEAFRLGCMATG